MEKLINLTPHKVIVFNDDMTILHEFNSEGVARVSTSNVIVGYYDLVPIYRQTFGEVVGLPEYQKGTIYIVSNLVKNALPERKDLLTPADLVRDSYGTVIGCKAFSR